ncbi:MAG TPA: hypothetical protein VFT59_04350, partial [Candidatus Saccharimonadales bacterium]|nr:hypothetical protein [Candidatus Saccharimonadales bacterium]
MQEIKAFIDQARQKGLDDETIRKSLEVKGWDMASVNLALAGLEAPAPVAAKQSSKAAAPTIESTADTPSLSHPMAALLHVILWFFTASSTVTIGGAIASLYGIDISAKALASMLAVTLITFIPYAVLYSIFLRKNSRLSRVVPGR